MRCSKTLLPLSCVIAAMLGSSTTVAQQQQPSILQQERHVILPSPPSSDKTPTDEAASQALSPEEKALRQRRSDSFNNTLGLAPRLEDLAKTGGGIGWAADRVYVPPLPVDSPSIVIGHVVAAQSHLSTDHSNIYTELKLQIEQVLKDNTETLTADSSLDVLEHGGSVLLNGQTLHVPTSPSGQIDLGKRYLLFLHYRSQVLKAFGVTQAWLLEQNHPQPTWAYRAEDHDVAPYIAMNESEFTSYVQRAIRTHSTH